MKLIDKVDFCLRNRGAFLTLFISLNDAENDNYLLLGYVFDGRYKEWYPELLSEIEQIEKGEKERNEECGLVDLSDPGELIIYKDITILEREEEGKRIEIPTSEFKQLVIDWIKFVDVNTKAFTEK